MAKIITNWEKDYYNLNMSVPCNVFGWCLYLQWERSEKSTLLHYKLHPCFCWVLITFCMKLLMTKTTLYKQISKWKLICKKCPRCLKAVNNTAFRHLSAETAFNSSAANNFERGKVNWLILINSDLIHNSSNDLFCFIECDPWHMSGQTKRFSGGWAPS